MVQFPLCSIVNAKLCLQYAVDLTVEIAMALRIWL